MFGLGKKRKNGASGPIGQRAYVVGDVHGMDALLDDLLAQIERDLAERPVRKALLVFVGDLIDRGPGSAQVIERLRTYRHGGLRTVFLLGNHEEVLLRLLGGDTKPVSDWRAFGGKECMASYGADPAEFAAMDKRRAAQLVGQLVPKEHRDFLATFADTCRFGDYLIVHAGVRPGVELEQQSQADLRWIRGPFLDDLTDHGFVVVHGHTIVPTIEERANRIGIDTGAYRTGILTALVIEEGERRFLSARAVNQPTPAPMH